MNNVSLDIENATKLWALSAKSLSSKVNDVLSQYFATDAAGLVDGLANVNTPATVSTGLTKGELQNMIGALEQAQKFFTNQVVTQGDYLNSMQDVLHGSHPAAAVLSNNVEDIGQDLKAVASQMIGLAADAKSLVALFNGSGLGAAINAISSTTVVFGASSTASKYLQGIVLLDNFQKYVNNLVVTQGDYLASVLAWAE